MNKLDASATGVCLIAVMPSIDGGAPDLAGAGRRVWRWPGRGRRIAQLPEAT